MQTLLIVLVATLLVISAAACVAPRLGIPAPLILVMAGIGVSVIPGVPDVVIDPDIILIGLLPPLLYASATSIPVMNLRREFRAISALAVVLVVLSALALGALFAWLIPGLGFGWGVALGAILSPTDAVATTIIKGSGAPNRVAVVLDGESLLNDASALIVLRTAVAATALGFSFWPTFGNFAWAVFSAFVVGKLAASINLAIRRRVRDEAVNTILSFTTPFAAAIPAEMLHGSGLVAAVVAGLVIGNRAARDLPPRHRVSDAQTWATVEIALEGAIFLTMGLQLSAIVRELASEPAGLSRGLGLAAAALAVTLAVRALYVSLLVRGVNRSAARRQSRQSEVAAMQAELEAGRLPERIARRAGRPGRRFGAQMLERMVVRGRRYLADLDYLARQPLGRAEVGLMIWAGMRGAVTVAAAQLLPAATPHRPLLVFIAFAVATMSLLLQGGTIRLFVARFFAAGPNDASLAAERAQRVRLAALVDEAAARVARTDGTPEREHRLAVLSAQRLALLGARDDGVFDAQTLALALRDVDIDEIVLELRSPQA